MDEIAAKAFLFAVGDYSRFSIMVALAKKEMCVNEIVEATGMKQSNVSHHMQCLLNCGFVTVKKEGQFRIYELNTGVRQMVKFMIMHIEKYKDWIKSCEIAKKEYIMKVIEWRSLNM